MVTPNYIIIGAQKGGTVPAKYHMNQHPDCYMHDREAHFFDFEDHYSQGISYYERMFANVEAQAVGEKTPSLMYLRYAMNRVYEYNKDIKLVMLLRDPVSRAYSQWNMDRQLHTQELSFLDGFKKEEYVRPDEITTNGKYYFRRGCYIEHIEYVLSMFPRHNLHIAVSEQIKANPLKEYNKIFAFLGLRPLERSELQIRSNVHKRKYGRKITFREFQYCYSRYRLYNERLYRFLGSEITEWERAYEKKKRDWWKAWEWFPSITWLLRWKFRG